MKEEINFIRKYSNLRNGDEEHCKNSRKSVEEVRQGRDKEMEADWKW